MKQKIWNGNAAIRMHSTQTPMEISLFFSKKKWKKNEHDSVFSLSLRKFHALLISYIYIEINIVQLFCIFNFTRAKILIKKCVSKSD